MLKKDDKALLPDGLSDTLLPNADIQSDAGRILASTFRNFGYSLITPPLLEFEETLLSGTGIGAGEQTFRVMDPESQRMMGVRSDMTVQVARIATTKLKNTPRPLRLMYAGDVLRVKGTTMRPDRCFKQYGVELIGTDSAEADGEVILLSLEALANAGIPNVSVDINIPSLPQLTADSLGIDFADVAVMFEKRDVSAADKLGGKAGEVLSSAIQCTGRADGVLKRLKAIDLNAECTALIKRTAEVVEILKTKLDSNIMVTVDACETRGFSFQTGIGFTLFSADSRGELGRGGRYVLEDTNESSVGFSIYSDSLATVLPKNITVEKIYAPFNTEYTVIKKLRGQGKIIVSALAKDTDVNASATECKCTHILINNNIESL